MPSGLDLLTLFVVFGLSHGLLTLILFAVWRENPSPGVGRLALGQGCIFFGALLAALGGPLPPVVTIFGANLVFGAGTALILEGVRLFYGLVPRRLVLIAVVAATLLSYPIQVGPSPNPRIMLESAALCGLLAASAWSAWSGGRRDGVYTRLVLSAFAVHSLAAGARAVQKASALREGAAPVLGVDRMGGLLLLVASLSAIVWTLGIIVTMNRRLLAAVAAGKAQLEVSMAAAEVASHAKSDFVANLSHEIRTPLMACSAAPISSCGPLSTRASASMWRPCAPAASSSWAPSTRFSISRSSRPANSTSSRCLSTCGPRCGR